MPRDEGDDAYAELQKERQDAERLTAQALHARKLARRKPPRPSKSCRSCGCAQKYHKDSRGPCEADVEILTYSGPAPSACGCKAFNP